MALIIFGEKLPSNIVPFKSNIFLFSGALKIHLLFQNAQWTIRNLCERKHVSPVTLAVITQNAEGYNDLILGGPRFNSEYFKIFMYNLCSICNMI